MLEQSATALVEAYDLAMLDLDGVVYVGPRGGRRRGPGHLAGRAEAGIARGVRHQQRLAPARQVAAHLRELGVEAEDADVVTSAQAAARLLADRLRRGRPRCS